MLIRIYILTLIIILLFVKIFYYSESFATEEAILKDTDPAYIPLIGLEYEGQMGNPHDGLDQCKTECKENDSCHGYEIDTSANTCQIITEKIDYKELKSNSNKNVYMKKCHVGCTPEEQSKSNQLKAQFDKLIAENKNYQAGGECPIIDAFVKSVKTCP